MNAKKTFRKFLKQPDAEPELPFPSQRKLRERHDLEFLFIRNPESKVIQVNGSMDCTIADPQHIPSNFKEFKDIVFGPRGCTVETTDGSTTVYANASMTKTTILGSTVVYVEHATVVTLKETGAKVLCYFGSDERHQQYLLDVDQKDQPAELLGRLETASLEFGIPEAYGKQPVGLGYVEVAEFIVGETEKTVPEGPLTTDQEEELLANQAIALFEEANDPTTDPKDLEVYRPESPSYQNEETEVINKHQDYINDEVNRLTKIALSRVALVERRSLDNNPAKKVAKEAENVDPTWTTFTDKDGNPMTIEQAMEIAKRKSAERKPRTRM